jgi:hypothetical protein
MKSIYKEKKEYKKGTLGKIEVRNLDVRFENNNKTFLIFKEHATSKVSI